MPSYVLFTGLDEATDDHVTHSIEKPCNLMWRLFSKVERTHLGELKYVPTKILCYNQFGVCSII